MAEGRTPDRAPFAPNIGQWFGAHKAKGTLPAELADCTDEVDAMKRMGCDIFSRRCGHFVTIRRGNGIEAASEKLDAHTTRNVLRTPHGELSSVSVFQPESHTSYEREHFWKDFEKEYPAIRYLTEHTAYEFDANAHRAADARVGDDGLAIVGAQQTPLKYFIQLAGAENAMVWLAEYPGAMRELAELHVERTLAFARQVANGDAFGMMSMDNLCSLFYTPRLFDAWCRDYYARIGQVLHARGKFWCAHACGRVSTLRNRVADVQLDGLEGTPHAPLGDIELARFRDTIAYDRHVVWGGMTCHEQEFAADARGRIHAFVKGLFETLRPFHRFVFSSACNTSIRTPWDNLRHFQDACYAHGRN
ncbi:MAG: hypothetical protein M5U26_13610 [Planctomycetota bacterium]|nr:hypothetical protein [Planctomycetota bacterium]